MHVSAIVLISTGETGIYGIMINAVIHAVYLYKMVVCSSSQYYYYYQCPDRSL